MRSNRVVISGTALALGAVLAVAACGGDDDDEGARPTVTREAGDDDTGSDDTGSEDTGSEPAGDADAGGLDADLACTAVGQDEASELFGEAARTAEGESPAPYTSSCFWENADTGEPGQVDHLLQVYVYDGAQYYSESVAPDAEPLEGLGDEAFVTVIEGVNPQVGVTARVDDRVLVLYYSTVNVGVPDEAKVDATQRRDALVELARTAIDRI